MSEARTQGKPGRPSRTLEEEILAAEERLRHLRERKKADDARDRERNQKAIMALIKAEGLDLVPADQWRAATHRLRSVLRASAAPAAAGT